MTMTINWLQPYTSERPLNIGAEFNRMIALMPDDGWIGITDHDCMFLRPDSKAQIAHIAATHGHEYDVFGPLTNRLYGWHQQYDGFSDEPDINRHVHIADKCHADHFGQVVETDQNIAAMCMVFNKSNWTRVGGFPEHSITLDKDFTDAVMATGGRLAVMIGVYVFHLYRWGKPSPAQYTRHLI